MASVNSNINKSDGARKKLTKPMPKSTATLWCESLKIRTYAFADKIKAIFFGDSWASMIMWLFVVLACLCLLAWLFFISPFGTPTEPVYEGF